MDIDSIDKRSRHIKDIRRFEAEISGLTDYDKERLIEYQKEIAAMRWGLCSKSFKMLFMMLNRDNHFPADSFNVMLKRENVGETTYDTYVRVWRSKDHQSYHIKPYIDCGSGIIDSTFETESFGREFIYRYGTHYSHSANVIVSSDTVEPEMKLTRINGMLVHTLDDKTRSIYLAALENKVMPSLDQTEESLILIYTAMLDSTLNPELAKRARINHKI